MYKVFINDKVICFVNNSENYNSLFKGLVLNFFTASLIPFIIDLLNNDDKTEVVIIEVEDFGNAFITFQTYFKIIKAAGGIVNNDNNEKLFIYRLEKWDLPKGKMENRESIEDAALREIEEECGISNLTIIKQLKDTYHIYKLKDKIILKQTYWFDMRSSFEGNLVPQLEEGITKVEWLNDEQIYEKVIGNTYASIKDLLTT
jgi:8-oxo-dGTP pyrophosphatase MutT (NUDIX family)